MALQALGQDKARGVVSSCIKESIAKGKTISTRDAVAKYNIAYGKVLGSMSKSWSSGLNGAVIAASPELPSINYKPNPGSPQPKTHPVITINILKGAGRAWKGAFVARMKSGHVGVYTRKQASRLPISQGYSIGPGQEFLAKRRGLDVTIPNEVAEFYNGRLISKTLAALGGVKIGRR